MKYDYSVVYNGKFYRAGEEVPVKENKTEKTVTNKAENKAVEKEKADSEASTTEVKKTSKGRAKP